MDEVPFVIRFQTSPMIYFLLLAVKYIYRNQERFVKRNALIAVEIPRWLGFLKINRGFLTEDTGWEGSFYKSVSFDPNKGNQEGSFVFKRPKMSNQTTSNPLTRSDPRITTSHLDSQKEEFEDEPTLASRVMSISLNVSEDSALVETQLAAIATTATADDHQHERFSAGGPSPSSTYESMITPRKLKAYASLLSLRSTSSLAPLPSSTTPDVPAQKVMGKFLSGFQRFHKTYFASNGNFFESLRHRQSPKTLIIGCSDSRVDPAIITDCDPGDLFVVRNVANLVAPYEPNYKLHGVSAALEFAIKTLKVESIIVLGHTHCGGIEHLMEGDSQDTEFLWAWMQIARRAKERTLKWEFLFKHFRLSVIFTFEQILWRSGKTSSVESLRARLHS